MTDILRGVRVLDFGRYVAGPFCSALLADLGAEVIRVERPGGGDDRFLMPASDAGTGAMFLQVNRGKSALTLDLSRPEARDVIRRMIPHVDVVVANLSASALGHLGLDFESLKAIREDIILTTISAFGSDGPLAEAVGFDGVGQAVSGAIHLTGEPGRPYRSATSYVDYSTALASAFGTMAALFKRANGGGGSHVETSLAGTALNIMNPVLMEQATGYFEREATGNRSPIAGPSDIFAARDGWFIMQVIGTGMFKRWTRLVEAPELFNDPRFADDILRGRNGQILSDRMSAWAATRTRDDCLARLAEVNLAASPVLSPADLIGGALGLSQAFFQTMDYPGTPTVPLVTSPVSVSKSARETPDRAPLVGEHTETLLAGFGFGAAEIAEMKGTGLV